jgi:Co/Zn/Cd efflux system component
MHKIHNNSPEYWEQDHIFGENRIRTGERHTIIVIMLTASMMIIEVTAE